MLAILPFSIAEYLYCILIKTSKKFLLPLHKQTNKHWKQELSVIIPFPAWDFCCVAQIKGSICPSVL